MPKKNIDARVKEIKQSNVYNNDELIFLNHVNKRPPNTNNEEDKTRR